MTKPTNTTWNVSMDGGTNVYLIDTVSGVLVIGGSGPSPEPSPEVIFQRLYGAAEVLLQELSENSTYTRKQAEQWKRASYLAAGTGFAVILFSIAIVIFEGRPVGWLPAIAGAVVNGAGGLFFRQWREVNRRVDAISTKMEALARQKDDMSLIDEIEDGDEAAQAKGEFVSKHKKIFDQVKDITGQFMG